MGTNLHFFVFLLLGTTIHLITGIYVLVCWFRSFHTHASTIITTTVATTTTIIIIIIIMTRNVNTSRKCMILERFGNQILCCEIPGSSQQWWWWWWWWWSPQGSEPVCILVEMYQQFGETFCLHLPPWRLRQQVLPDNTSPQRMPS